MAKVAFLGLGVMGYPMAGHLAAAGHDVTVYNRTSAKADAWHKQHGGAVATTPADAARGAEFVFSCVGDDADIISVTSAEHGAFSAMSANAVFIDNTTASLMLRVSFMPQLRRQACISLMRLFRVVRLGQKTAS